MFTLENTLEVIKSPDHHRGTPSFFVSLELVRSPIITVALFSAVESLAKMITSYQHFAQFHNRNTMQSARKSRDKNMQRLPLLAWQFILALILSMTFTLEYHLCHLVLDRDYSHCKFSKKQKKNNLRTAGDSIRGQKDIHE